MYKCRADFMFGGVANFHKGQLLNDHHESVIGEGAAKLVQDGLLEIIPDQLQPAPKTIATLPTDSADLPWSAESLAGSESEAKPKRGRPKKTPAE